MAIFFGLFENRLRGLHKDYPLRKKYIVQIGTAKNGERWLVLGGEEGEIARSGTDQEWHCEDDFIIAR